MPNDAIDVDYRPSEDEPFMNQRQREYFRRKLLAWKEDILRESRETLVVLQTITRISYDLADRAVLRNGPLHRTSRARPPTQADLQDRCGARPVSRMAATAIARRRASRSRSSALMRGPSRLLDRGAGTPRAPRKGLSRRLSRGSRRQAASPAASWHIGGVFPTVTLGGAAPAFRAAIASYMLPG